MKYCKKTMKKKINKELDMSKEDKKYLRKTKKCWIYNKKYVDCDLKVRDYCHLAGKYRELTHRDCNTNLKLTHKMPALFHSLK